MFKFQFLTNNRARFNPSPRIELYILIPHYLPHIDGIIILHGCVSFEFAIPIIFQHEPLIEFSQLYSDKV